MKKLIMTLVLMPLMVLADTEIVNGIEWCFTILGGEATVGVILDTPAVPYDTVGAIEIPSTLGGYPVTSIGRSAFSGYSGLTTVTIPSSVTSIGDYAFSGCSGLTTVTIPSSVTSIGGYAFSGCSGLTTVTIPSSVTSIGRYAFSGCSGLTTVTIPSSVTSFGYRAFRDCSGLTSVTIPSSVTSIGGSAFSGCSGLTSVKLDDGLMVIGEQMFSGCTGLASVAIPSSVTSIGGYAFSGCSGLTSVKLDDGLMVIGEQMFSGCTGLTSVAIPSSVTSIGGYAFSGCTGLTSVTIPSSVTSIGGYAFSGCYAISEVRIDSIESWCGIAFDNDYGRDYSSNPFRVPSAQQKKLYVNGKETTELLIPVAFTAVPDAAFCGWDMLTTVTIPSSVTSIGRSAFSGCSGLTTVTIPSSVTSIGGSAFSGCSGLTSVTIPSSVTSIGGSAFSGCSGLTSVTIPSSVTSIGECGFSGCASLLRVYYLGNAPAVDVCFYDGTLATLVSYVREGSTGWSSGASADLPDSWQGRSIAHGEAPVVIDGVEWNFTTKNGKVSLGTGLMTAVGGMVSGGVTIPSEINGMKVVEIKDSAFVGLDGITSVIIPASVRTVGSKAFYGCDGLEAVTFLGDAPYVYDDAFSGTKSTLAFSVPQGSIGWSDTSLTSLPGAWKGHAIQYAGGSQAAGGDAASLGTVTVSNIVVHYVLNSIQPQFAISPSQDMGFVNIITEVKSTGVAAIPMSWAMNYPNFVSKFGSDFTAALGKPTGKIGTGGTPMLVWQDYVAGTDPTDEKDVFTASITIVDGKVTISYTPELDDARKAMRKYTTWGKTSLMDADWTEVQEGRESEYNFFKVSVEMR